MFPGPICVSLIPKNVAEVFHPVTEGADCIEVRLDYLDNPAASDRIQWRDLPAPVIATCRGRDQGGRFAGSIDDEMRILERAVQNGARWVDVDYRFARQFGPAKVIGSYHDFESTPENLEGLLDAVCQSPVAVAKIATFVRTWSDNRRLLELLEKSWPKPVIVIGMGPMGQITRIIGPSRGSALTYTGVGAGSAPGQLTLRDLIDTYRFREIGRSTQLIGIVGNPVDHSRSPLLHNSAFQAAGLDYVYMKFPVERVDDFFDNAGPIGISGFSVTIPHKVTVLPYLEQVSAEARAVGAVNTVYRDEDQWKGDNTDVHGIREALKGFDARGKKVVVLGTGGAARAAVAALDSAESVTVLSRTREAGTLDWSRQVQVDRLENCSSYETDLLVNATPVGMTPDIESTPVSGPIHAKLVFDMVYNPPQTRLLRDAGAQGKQVVRGTAMFVAQAARQFEIWTGKPAPESVYGAPAVPLEI